MCFCIGFLKPIECKDIMQVKVSVASAQDNCSLVQPSQKKSR